MPRRPQTETTPSPFSQLAIAVLDDDVWSLRLVRGLLRECFPGARIEVREEPDPSGEFDVWFLDNEFEGRKLAPELTVEVREKNPDALIFACSATLDASCLKELLNAGADGACDKSLPEDLISAMGVIRAYAAELPARRAGGRGRPRGGVLGAIESIRGLLREWNSRLDREETASQEHAR